jgi:glycosyltransferase involved in cell wall biosynthesis
VSGGAPPAGDAGAAQTLAVVMHKTGATTERFIERHVRESFGGRTVVLARHAGGTPDFERPLLVADAVRGGALQRLAAWPARLLAYARHRYWGLPVGGERRAILRFWREHGVTAVLAEFGPLGCWIAPLAHAAGLPVFVYFRGYDASSRLRSARTVRAYRHMLAMVDGVFAVSDFLVEQLRRAGLEHRNTHVVPSGTDTRRFAPGAKEPGLVVAVGRFVAKKRPEANVDAFAAVAARWPQARLQMVGDGPRLEACRALARRHGLEPRVQFLGARDHDFVARLLARAEVFLQHSVTAPGGETEGLPSSIQEAMAAGAVVVSTRHAGIAEVVIDGRTGWLVDENDVDGYARALARVFEDPARAQAMARRARRLAEERLDTRGLQQRLEAVIVQAVQQRRAAVHG